MKGLNGMTEQTSSQLAAINAAQKRLLTPDLTDAQQAAIDSATGRLPVVEDDVVFNKGGIKVREIEGNYYLSSAGYSTSDQAKIKKIMEAYQDTPQEDIREDLGAKMSRSSINQGIVRDRPLSSFATQVLNVPYAGEYVDEVIGQFGGERKQSDFRAMRNAMSEEYPWTTAGANLTGGLAVTAPLLASLPKGAAATFLGTGGKILPKAVKTGLTGGLLGGTEGFISGLGTGETTPERLANATSRGLWGTGLGAVMPLGIGLGIKLGKYAFDVAQGTSISKIANYFNISKNAAIILKDTVADDGNIDNAIKSIQKAGDNGMLADASEATKALLDASSVGSTTGSKIVGEELADRAQRTRQGLEQNINQNLGTPVVGSKTAVRDIAEKSSKPRSDAYTEAYATPIRYIDDAGNIDPKGQKILDTIKRVEPEILNNAIKRANASMRMAQRPLNKHIKATIGDDGEVVFEELPNVEQLDELKKALQKIAWEDNVDEFGRLTGTGTEYNNVARDLKDAVSDSVPRYKDAVKIGGDKIAEEQAFVMGQDLLRKSTKMEDVMQTFGTNASDAEKAAGKQGLRLYLQEALDGVKAIASGLDLDSNAGREVSQIVKDLSSKEARNKIRLILGKDADAMLKQIDEAAKTSSVVASQAANSKTAQRLQIQNKVDELTERKNLSASEVKNVLDQVMGDIGDGSLEQKKAIFTQLAKVLTRSKGKTAEAALRYINEASRTGKLTEAKREFIAQASALVGYSTVPITTKKTEEAFR
jgi:hypothetical protein